MKVKVAAGEFSARFPEITLLPARLIVPPAWTPKLVTATERLDAADTSPTARITRVETLLVKVRSLVTSSFPPVSSRSVFAVIVASSAAVSDKVPATSVPPAVMARELVNGSNLTAPLPALTEPVKPMLFARIVTSVLVTAKAAPIDNSAVEEVEASKTIDTAPVELNDKGLKTRDVSVTIPDLVAL